MFVSSVDGFVSFYQFDWTRKYKINEKIEMPKIEFEEKNQVIENTQNVQKRDVNPN